MHEKIPRVMKQKAIIMCQKGATEADAAKACGISERTLRRAKSNQRQFGDIDGGHKKRGRPTVFVPLFVSVMAVKTSELMVGNYSHGP